MILNQTETMSNITTEAMVSTPATATLSWSSTTLTTPQGDNSEYNLVLMVIYSVVLVVGTISLSLMMHIMKSGRISTTSIAVLNLIFAHFIFLLTVPFRIYYYASNNWSLGDGWCKVISSMIHIHMYMSFIFYVIILITRQLIFYRNVDVLASPPRIHALVVSAVLWLTVFIIITCVIYFRYGKTPEGSSNGQCFNFAKNIESDAKVFNYILSSMIILVAFALTMLQANVLRVLYRKHRNEFTSQQDFGAQFKSLCFALIMFACLVPYHIFRLYYLEHLHLQSLNEVLLSLTTFNCLDMLTFLGRRTCSICYLGNSI